MFVIFFDCFSASPTSEHGGSPNDRQTASFFGSASSRPTPVYGQGGGGGVSGSSSSSIRSMSSGRFTAGNGSGVASATRFSTSRHEGFRMTTPTRTRPSHGVISHYYGHHNGCQITAADRLNNQCTSPIHGLSYGRSYRSVEILNLFGRCVDLYFENMLQTRPAVQWLSRQRAFQLSSSGSPSGILVDAPPLFSIQHFPDNPAGIYMCSTS